MHQYQGVIQSPNYPEKYPRRESCSWVIDFGYGMDIYLAFEYFAIESQPNCTFDYISMHPGRLWTIIDLDWLAEDGNFPLGNQYIIWTV